MKVRYDDFWILTCLRRRIELLFAAPLPLGETFRLVPRCIVEMGLLIYGTTADSYQRNASLQPHESQKSPALGLAPANLRSLTASQTFPIFEPWLRMLLTRAAS
jgi:hypothetical protein